MEIVVRRGSYKLQMTEYPRLTQQAAFSARVASLSEAVAKKIASLPEDTREAGLTTVHRSFAAQLKENGLDNEHGRKWLDLQMNAIRRMVIEGDEHKLRSEGAERTAPRDDKAA
jgi:hypothetical protein